MFCIDFVNNDKPTEFTLCTEVHHALSNKFDTRLSIDDNRRGIDRWQHTQGASHEIRISRSVQQVDESTIDFKMAHARFERVLEALLLVRVITNCGALVDTTG